MVITLGEYRAVPLNEHCWRLQKRASGDARREWNDVDCYKPTLSGAVGELWERAARDMGGECPLEDPTALLAALAGLRDGFVVEVCGKAAR